MSRRELDAAGITDPRLRLSYEACRALNAAARQNLLPRDPTAPTREAAICSCPVWVRPLRRRDRRRSWQHSHRRAARAVAADLGRSASWPTSTRVTVTMRSAARWSTRLLAGRFPREHFEAFLHSMAMDLTVTEYADYDALYEYVYGSAAVIGLQMVPILEPTSDEAASFAS